MSQEDKKIIFKENNYIQPKHLVKYLKKNWI